VAAEEPGAGAPCEADTPLEGTTVVYLGLPLAPPVSSCVDAGGGHARMELDDLVGQLAAIDREIEQLRMLRGTAIKAADFREVNRLQAAIGRLVVAQDQLRARRPRRTKLTGAFSAALRTALASPGALLILLRLRQ
jgi:hypothetical protein